MGSGLWSVLQVICVSPAVDAPSAAELRVSLNSQIFSIDSVIYAYGYTTWKHDTFSHDFKTALAEARDAGAAILLSSLPIEEILTMDTFEDDKYLAPSFVFDQWGDRMFDYVPFSPDNCIYFEVGDHTSLQNLELDKGKLIPEFASDVYEYSVLLYADQVTDMLIRVKASTVSGGATIHTGTGEMLQSGASSPAYSLRVGENRILLSVTSKNGIVARTYMITVYVLLESLAGYSLSSIIPSEGAIT